MSFPGEDPGRPGFSIIGHDEPGPVTPAIDINAYLKDFTFIEKNESPSLFPAEKSRTRLDQVLISDKALPKFINEFWTSKQRQASSIHEISYRACFKPQLPRFFISLLTREGQVVYDPFSGRGTTVIEAGLQGRRFISNDVNPLSRLLTEPRFHPPDPMDVKARLAAIPMDYEASSETDLSMFYHPKTEAEIVSLRNYLTERKAGGQEDDLDGWIRMAATNRLTGHSPGFFSVYTLPPNQAVSPERQIKINRRRNQKPDYRDTRALILRKTRSLVRNLGLDQKRNMAAAARDGLFLTKGAADTAEIESGTVDLTVTSPPFLDVVQYSQDNWLRCWFNGLDADSIAASMTMARTIDQWSSVMGAVFRELFRITRPGGWVAFEVGEIKKRAVRLEEHVVPLGLQAGFECRGILINTQEFTKTSNIWGVDNNRRGTNTNRIVLFNKSTR